MNSSCCHFKLKTKSAKESRRKTKSFFNNKQRKVNLGLQTNDYLVFIHGESSKLSIGLLRRKKAECVCLHWVKWSVVHPSVVAIWSCYLSVCTDDTVSSFFIIYVWVDFIRPTRWACKESVFYICSLKMMLCVVEKFSFVHVFTWIPILRCSITNLKKEILATS